jgi:ubiquinol-cytochrome c reductase cytochrome c subunit
MNRFLFVLLALAMLHVGIAQTLAQSPAAGAQAGSKPAAQEPAGDVEKGRKLYVSYGCYQCHGYEAQGSTATGPRLGPRPLPYAAFARYLRQPTGQMPPYTAKVVSDADVADIYGFVRARPAPPPVDRIPLLK